jgi:two-component system sensor histidine kinase UhpB
MADRLDRRPRRVRTDRRVGAATVGALFWRLLLVNGLVFVAGATVLVLSPATISTPISVRELAVLALGLAVMLAATAFLLRAALKPLDGLVALMERVDLLRPGERVPTNGHGDIAHLIRTFNEMLDRLEAERGASTARTLAAQEGERQRIAQELHDEIGQSLTAVLLGLKRTIGRVRGETQEELRALQEMVRATLDEVRQVARRLRPGVLDDLGLLSAINALAADLSEASRLPVTRRLDRRLPPLSRETELVIYRIAQESLTNVARHAEASHVELSLAVEEDHVLLCIADDGRGMDGRREGAGIRGMRERALLIAADLTVQSRPGRGTEVRLVVPKAPDRR